MNIYEKITTEEREGEVSKKVTVVEKAEATHIHICGHNSNPPTPCRRIPINLLKETFKY
jgi:hypothetical protein